ncbi:MAG TPA: hypothetical protein VGQ24_13390, partial [Gemmatimonadales bacterium]|nr:hypothetical protein [Gemmatimonadales bacterium]
DRHQNPPAGTQAGLMHQPLHSRRGRQPAADLAQEPKLTNSDSILIEEDSKRALVRTYDEG